MWHRFLWPKDTDWSHSNSTLRVVVHMGTCACMPTRNWCSIRRNRSYYNVNMKPSNYFPGSAVRKKMEMKGIYCYFPSARRPWRQWDIFSARVHWSSPYWLQCSSVNLHQQRCDLLLAWNLYRQSIIQSGAGCVFYGATSALVYTHLSFVKTCTVHVQSSPNTFLWIEISDITMAT